MDIINVIKDSIQVAPLSATIIFIFYLIINFKRETKNYVKHIDCDKNVSNLNEQIKNLHEMILCTSVSIARIEGKIDVMQKNYNA